MGFLSLSFTVVGRDRTSGFWLNTGENIKQLEAVIKRKARTFLCRKKFIAAILKNHSPLNVPLKTK